ncbi:MAG: ATP-binding protein [Acidobacterium ailaaui]|nr:ATP-binding protein [Pseudacidobacterium ailaaui]
MTNPEIGFTSDVIRDPKRFVGRADLVRKLVNAVNSPLNLVAIYGKRGVGKSSLARQLQQIALGDYSLLKHANLLHIVPEKPRKYLTVYYTCDSIICDVKDLLQRLLNDQNQEDGLLRLVPDDGKELVEFSRVEELSGGVDLKLVNWGTKGIESNKYAKVVENDVVQTFRNYVNAVVTHQVKGRMKRDGLLIILDEFDVLQNKEGIGSLIKSLSSDTVKFAICGIGNDLMDLVADHNSVERLMEEGALRVGKMDFYESKQIIERAHNLFKGEITFSDTVINAIAADSQGYPYLVQLLGKECVHKANSKGVYHIDGTIYSEVKDDIRKGNTFPTLESQYQRAIGDSEGRRQLLYILASQEEGHALFNEELGKIALKKVRKDAELLSVEYIDQLLPRLIDKKFGPVLTKSEERQGIYEFVNPIFRIYCQLREL